MSWNDDICQTGVLNFERRSDKVKCSEKLWEIFYQEYNTCVDDQERDDTKKIYHYTLNGIKIAKGYL